MMKDWEAKYGECNYCILDDDDGDLFLFKEKFVQTKWYSDTYQDGGLTEEIAEEVISLLNDKAV